MNKMLALLALISILIFPQDDKGRITLTLNGETFDLPVSSINLRKERKILIAVRADQPDSVTKKMITMELGFEALSSEKKKGFDLFSSRIQVSSVSAEGSGMDLILDLGEKSEAFLTKYTRSERVQSNINQFEMKIDDYKIAYDGEKLTIQMTINGKWRWTEKNKLTAEVAEIKDCRIMLKI